jgi:hypothetical protein
MGRGIRLNDIKKLRSRFAPVARHIERVESGFRELSATTAIRSPKSVPDTVSRSREFQVHIHPRARVGTREPVTNNSVGINRACGKSLDAGRLARRVGRQIRSTAMMGEPVHLRRHAASRRIRSAACTGAGVSAANSGVVACRRHSSGRAFRALAARSTIFDSTSQTSISPSSRQLTLHRPQLRSL